MTDKHWAIFALNDIKNALDREKYESATYHISDAIEAILETDAGDPVSHCRAKDIRVARFIRRS
ncbi:MAG: hypothetical protein AAGF27_10500 [Pseudomonadota bacterium]